MSSLQSNLLRNLERLSSNDSVWLLPALGQLDLLESKERCETKLIDFVREAWHVVEPGNPFIDNWHISAICDHLEAVTYGDITRLLINVPPGFSKSLLLNVFWPAWEWAVTPHLRFICTSHSQNLAIRDSTKMRRLVQSDWYRARWGDVVKLVGDQNAKTKFENQAYGFREALAFESLTGSRGDRVTIDDPHSVDGAMSDAMRASTIETFLEAVPTRLNNPKTSAIIVIMQRLHVQDVSGVIIDKQLGYEYLRLPMEFDASWPCETSIGFKDPRTEEGELLFPERFPREVVERDKQVMGPYACNPYEAPVLLSDLTMKPIGEVRVGDEIVGFEKRKRSDDKKGRMRLTRAVVTQVHSRRAPVVKMTLDSGEVIRCTPDHRWFKKDRSSAGRSMYSPARLGDKLARVCPPSLPKLSSDEERLAGWLGGFFDGEGTVVNCAKRAQEGEHRPSASVFFYQGSGRNLPLCEKLERTLDHFGFAYSYTEDERKPNKDAPCYGYRAYRLRDTGLPMLQKFLHVAQPVKWRDRLIDGAYGAKFIRGRERVVSIEPDGEETVYALTTTTGNYVVWGLASSNCAGQFQQVPTPRGGGIIKREWWTLYDEEEAAAQGVKGGAFPPMSLIVASLDPAYTEKKENDYSALTIWGVWSRRANLSKAVSDIAGQRIEYADGIDSVPAAMLMFAWKKRLPIHGPEVVRRDGEDQLAFLRRKKEAQGLVETVADACKRFKVDVLLIEAKGPGISVGQSIKALHRYDGFSVRLIDPGKADKVARAYAVQSIFSGGQVYAPERPWADMVISEFEAFPRGAHDDLVDSTTQCLKFLRDGGMLQRPGEIANETVESLRNYRPNARPIYEV